MKRWLYFFSMTVACAPAPPAAHPAARTARAETSRHATTEVSPKTPNTEAGAFVRDMHRSIHRLWGFGWIEEWQEKPSTDRLNDPSLSVTVEIALNRDGTVARVALVRSSRYTPFDAAAVDVAYAAGPYPRPAASLVSANGKTYVHWTFYRDARQCNGSDAALYVLDKIPPSATPPDAGLD